MLGGCWVFALSIGVPRDKEKKMPFKSESQKKYLWAKRPDIAKRWTRKYGSKVQSSTKKKK